jgi:hypothetical protein
MNRLTEASLKYNFVIKYKKGSEIPADFLSKNSIDAVGIFPIIEGLNKRMMNFASQSKSTCTPPLSPPPPKKTLHMQTFGNC